MSWHGGLPWDYLRHYYKKFRGYFFSLPRPEGEYFLVDATRAELEASLGHRGYAPNWEFSYDKGEDLNLAAVVYAEEADHEHIEWWQTHVRGWVTDRGVEVAGHWEPEPTEHARPHLRGTGYDREQGMRALRDALTSGGHAPEVVTYERG